MSKSASYQNTQVTTFDVSLGSKEGQRAFVYTKEPSHETALCLAAVHALIFLADGTIVGGPMKIKYELEVLDWLLAKGRSRFHACMLVKTDVHSS